VQLGSWVSEEIPLPGCRARNDSASPLRALLVGTALSGLSIDSYTGLNDLDWLGTRQLIET